MALNYVDLSYAAQAITTTPATMIGTKASTNIALRWLETMASADGSTSTATPAKVEICENTFATNAPGTNSTSITVSNGRRDIQRNTPQMTAAYTWTAEPTVIIVLRTLSLPQYNGLVHGPIAA